MCPSIKNRLTFEAYRREDGPHRGFLKDPRPHVLLEKGAGWKKGDGCTPQAPGGVGGCKRLAVGSGRFPKTKQKKNRQNCQIQLGEQFFLAKFGGKPQYPPKMPFFGQFDPFFPSSQLCRAGPNFISLEPFPWGGVRSPARSYLLAGKKVLAGWTPPGARSPSARHLN